jgi:hypothetical protein
MDAPRFRQSDLPVLLIMLGYRFSLIPRWKRNENAVVVRWLGVTVVWRKR